VKHSSENQGPFTQAEYEEMLRDGRRKRYIDIIMILESNGFKVVARQEAVDQENTQMVAILKARDFLVIDKKNISENDKMEMETLLSTLSNKGDDSEETKEELEVKTKTEEKSSKGIEEKKDSQET